MARIPECRGILLSLPLACNRLVLTVRGVGLYLLTVIVAFLFSSSLSARSGGATASAGEEGTVNALGLNERGRLCALDRLGLSLDLLMVVSLARKR